MSGLTLLNLFPKRAAAKPAVAMHARRSFEPLAQSAFRALGLAATASQREVFDAASSMRLALKLGVQKTFERDAEWLAPISRTESDVRDALGRLSEPSGRAFERLFWFHTDAKTASASNVAELRAQVDTLLSEDAPDALHDAALLMLAGLLRLDPALEDADAWTLVLKLWRETVEREEFWSLLVAADLNGEFEQPVTFGEVRQLRLRTPRLVSAPIAGHAKDATLRGDLRACARAFKILRGGGLPAALVEEYERDTLGPAEDRLEEACDAVAASALAGGFMPSESEAMRYNNAWEGFERKVKPQLRDFVDIGGAESAYVRRALERASDKLRELAERYRTIGLHGQSATLLLEARSLAPPGCEASERIGSALLILKPGSEVGERSFEDYARALARELAERRVPPKLPQAYAAAPVAKTDTSAGCGAGAIFWLVIVVLSFALQKCGGFNSRRSNTFPPPNLRMINMNINTNIVIPKFKPVSPVITIPPYLMPQPGNRNAGRGARRRRAQPRGTTNDTTTLNLNLKPPAIVAPTLNRNGTSPSRNAPPRD